MNSPRSPNKNTQILSPLSIVCTGRDVLLQGQKLLFLKGIILLLHSLVAPLNHGRTDSHLVRYVAPPRELRSKKLFGVSKPNSIVFNLSTVQRDSPSLTRAVQHRGK